MIYKRGEYQRMGEYHLIADARVDAAVVILDIRVVAQVFTI